MDKGGPSSIMAPDHIGLLTASMLKRSRNEEVASAIVTG